MLMGVPARSLRPGLKERFPRLTTGWVRKNLWLVIRKSSNRLRDNPPPHTSLQSSWLSTPLFQPRGTFSRPRAGEEGLARGVERWKDELGADAFQYTGTLQVVAYPMLNVRKTEADAA